MVQNKDISIEVITQKAVWTAKSAIEKIFQGKHKDIHTRHRGETNRHATI